jgi:hypothetical protein
MTGRNPRLSKFGYLNLTTMNAAFERRFGPCADGTAMEPALPSGNTCPKSRFSPICAIAPPHRPPNNGCTA